MKCPFRTITSVEKTPNKTVVSNDYAECLGCECPYFGKKGTRHDQTGPYYVTVPKCRRIDDERNIAR